LGAFPFALVTVGIAAVGGDTDSGPLGGTGFKGTLMSVVKMPFFFASSSAIWEVIKPRSYHESIRLFSASNTC